MNYQRGMIAQDGTVLSSEGWTIQDPKSGLLTYLDATGQPVGHDYAGASYASELGMLGEGQAVATDESGNALMSLDGQYIVAPAQATGLYDEVYPSFTPMAMPEQPAPAPPSTAKVPALAAQPSYQTSPSMSSFGGGGSYDGQRPSFANGVQHPLWSGQPLTPGGTWNTGEPSQRQQVYVPGGAAAGYTTRAANPVSGGLGGQYGSGGSGGGSGGGGGGSALYQAWRDKLTAKLYPGSGSGYSGSSSGSSSGSGYPPEEKMHGQWAKRVDPSQASTLSYRPSMLIPRVAPGLSPTSPLYQEMAQEPAAALGMLMNGTQRVKQPVYPSTHYAADGSYHTTKGKSGNVGSTTVNSIGNFYDRAINKESYPTFDELMNNLDRAGKHSLIGTQLNQPLGYAAQNMSNLYGAAFSTLPGDTANAYQAEVDGLIDQYGSKFLRKPVGKAPAMNRWIGRRTSF